MSTTYLFEVPQTGLLTVEHYAELCDADVQGNTVYLLLPDGNQVHLRNVIFDIPKRPVPNALFRVRKGLIEGEYKNRRATKEGK